ncbi:PAS domain S-box protein [Methylovirgula sp. HY1]|uniref:sensor histidine kinase n=1 Tax=Methylovirgula sp. HY1 TaxID=2822761 RepID=UPI001C74D098|nr:PAS domain S-box protein [Methylovirgula sp. HY1]QXX76300.1 Blue-light-activated histidine kinase 1 [Methylovirgula sp. HY1]
MKVFAENSPVRFPASCGDDALMLPEHLFDLLPAGVCVCDRIGRIIRYNEAAVKLWGRTPRLGELAERFCGSYRLHTTGGEAIAHVECPMAHVLATEHGVNDQHIVIERPDGTRIIAHMTIEVLKNGAGEVIGAVNVFGALNSSGAHVASGSAHVDTKSPEVLPNSEARDCDAALRALPVAVYMTDAAGRITFFNDAAAQLWGQLPELGKDEFCGSWRLYWPDGTRMEHAACPMAMALREKQAIRDVTIIAERPDGTRVPVLPYPTPLFDASGVLTGAVNILIDLTGRQMAEEAAQRLAAIVESSDDAILAKNLDGVIMSWNGGAERLFGYSPEEAIGQPVTLLIPPERHDEEPDILGRLRRGERIEHYDTIRRRKDGRLIEISLTVSPILNAAGKIIGASKIARDITERRRAEEQQNLLVREMDHRVKNLFALASSVVTLSARSPKTVEDLIAAVRARLGALSRAHTLTLAQITEGAGPTEQSTTMHALIETIVAPFDTSSESASSRVVITGPDISIAGPAVTSLAMLLHEFATNAAKYGALSVHDGYVTIECFEESGQFGLIWSEHGGPPVDHTGVEGFGTMLGRATVKAQLEGEITRLWNPEGLTIRLSVARDRLIP